MIRSTLSQHVAAFCRELRQNNVAVGPAEIRDALRALDAVSVAREEDFREALRLTLCSSPDEQERFDRLFRLYFHAPRKSGQSLSIMEEAVDRPVKQQAKTAAPETEKNNREATSSHAFWPLPGHESKAGDQAKEEAVAFSLAARVSVQANNRTVSLRISEEKEEQLLACARAFIRALRHRESRRFVSAKHGGTVDLRRTLRQSLAYEGEPLLLARKERANREARFIVLCDGSRSMAGAAERVLQFAWALFRAARQVEVFLFSTDLTRITGQLTRARMHGAPELTVRENEWGSGTRIGESLSSFVTAYGGRLLQRDTIVIIASDGLDTGTSQEMQRAMGRIRERTAGVIWLNPFLSIPGYRPEAKGMKTALPFIDAFVPVDSIFTCSRWARHIQMRR